MRHIIDYNAVQPRNRKLGGSFAALFGGKPKVKLATIQIIISPHARPNRVELLSTVGITGVRRLSRLSLTIFRDGKQIFNTQQDIESARFRQFYFVTLQGIDRNVQPGKHVYTLFAENVGAANTRVDVDGPINFSGLAIKTGNR
ncbi:exosporium protein C [Cohnella suwonensis]|uniref:Exosporium protein C n=1 Tax=Cohnella suwonensis TaxID=696072 RepID=A0ABW0LMZ7_9BACL